MLAVVPRDSLSRWYLQRIDAATPRAVATPVARRRPTRTVVAARVRNRSFQVPDGRGGWKPIWIAGVNLGAALPGKHPSEFPPNDSTYERWIELFARMNANVIRLYTIHPPHFYQARAALEPRASTAAYLAHPRRVDRAAAGDEEEHYDDSTWNGDFQHEMRRVVDLLHGSASLPARPGHAHGHYDADVSPWVLAYILGREWEPYSVVAYAKRRARISQRIAAVSFSSQRAVRWTCG